MNPLTQVKNITKLNQTELQRGTTDKKSWHDIYKESAWIFVGGLAYGLTEGDILSVFSQYGEIVNINLVRDLKTGKTKGFCFICYANQKSTVLAVDNFNGIKVCARTIRVDHVANYKPPKENENEDDITKQLRTEGCAPRPIKVENTSEEAPEKRKSKKVKKEKKKHKKHKKKDMKQEGTVKEVKVKIEKHDSGYAKYELLGNGKSNQRAQGSDSEDSESLSDESSDGHSTHVSNHGSANSKAIQRSNDMCSNSADEHHRIKTTAHHNTHVAKRNSSSDESSKPKKSRSSDSSKRSESSKHHPSVSAGTSHRSTESYRYRASTQSRSKDSKQSDRSDSPAKDKYYSKHSHEHQRRDSSPFRESDMTRKYEVQEGEKCYRKHHEKKDSGKFHENYGSSSHNNYNDKDKKSKRSRKNESSSPNPYKTKSHKHASRCSRTEREKMT